MTTKAQDVIQGIRSRISHNASDAKSSGLIMRHDGNGPGAVLVGLAAICWICASVAGAICLFAHTVYHPFVEAEMEWALWDGWGLIAIALGISAITATFFPFKEKLALNQPRRSKIARHGAADELAVQGRYWNLRKAVNKVLVLPREQDSSNTAALTSRASTIVRVLSFGKMELPDNWDEAITTIDALSRMWKTQLGDISLSIDSARAEDAWRLGESLGVEAMVNAYISGVPVDDILA